MTRSQHQRAARDRGKTEVEPQERLDQVILESLPCPVLLLRPVSREIVSANQAARAAGAVPGEPCFSSWRKRQDPCPWCLAPRLWETGERQRREVEDGGKVLDTSWSPVSDDLYLHLAFDITEHRKVEESLSEALGFTGEIISSASEGIIVYDRDLRYLVWNPTMERISGVPASEVLGKPALELFPHLRKRGVDQLIRRALQGETLTSPDVPFEVPRTGRRGWVCGTYGPHRAAGGEIVGVIGMVREVTERKQIEQELARHQEHLQELVEDRTRELRASEEQLRRSERLASIGTLAAGIVHELNNPVGLILLAAEQALSQESPSPGAARALRTILEQARRSGDIIESIRTFSRAQTAEKSPGDLNRAIERAEATLRAEVRARGCRLDLDLAPALPPVMMNSTGIEQVLLNLVRNSLEAGASRIRVSSRPGEKSVAVTVADDGSGIPRDRMSRIFDPFYTTRRSQGGTGLGLSVSHGIVADHGGTIDGSSKPGDGATFVLHFPAYEPARVRGPAETS